MTTLGDVLLIFGGSLAVSFALWAFVVITTLAFPVQSARMARKVESSLWKMVGAGLLISLPVLTVATILAALPNPLTKFIGFVIYMAYLGVVAVGAGGIVRPIAERIRETSPDVSVYGATTRSGMLFVAALNVPLVGWFVLAPLAIAASAGCFAVGFFSRGPATQPAVGGN